MNNSNKGQNLYTKPMEKLSETLSTSSAPAETPNSTVAQSMKLEREISLTVQICKSIV